MRRSHVSDSALKPSLFGKVLFYRMREEGCNGLAVFAASLETGCAALAGGGHAGDNLGPPAFCLFARYGLLVRYMAPGRSFSAYDIMANTAS
jgi:hypothetical protein